MDYKGPVKMGDGWWFTRQLGDDTEVFFGPYPDRENCQYNLERIRREQIATPIGGMQQNLYDDYTWRSAVRDIFGTTSIEAYPPRGSRG